MDQTICNTAPGFDKIAQKLFYPLRKAQHPKAERSGMNQNQSEGVDIKSLIDTGTPCATGSQIERRQVYHAHQLSLDDIIELEPSHIVLSPSTQAIDNTIHLIKHMGASRPILGIGLGFIAVIQALGGIITQEPLLHAGQVLSVQHVGKGIFKGLPDGFASVCYQHHTVIIDNLPKPLDVTAWSQPPSGELELLRLPLNEHDVCQSESIIASLNLSNSLGITSLWIFAVFYNGLLRLTTALAKHENFLNNPKLDERMSVLSFHFAAFYGNSEFYRLVFAYRTRNVKRQPIVF